MEKRCCHCEYFLGSENNEVLEDVGQMLSQCSIKELRIYLLVIKETLKKESSVFFVYNLTLPYSIVGFVKKRLIEPASCTSPNLMRKYREKNIQIINDRITYLYCKYCKK